MGPAHIDRILKVIKEEMGKLEAKHEALAKELYEINNQIGLLGEAWDRLLQSTEGDQGE